MYSTYSEVNKIDPLPSSIIECISYEGHDGALYKAIFTIVRYSATCTPFSDFLHCYSVSFFYCRLSNTMNSSLILAIAAQRCLHCVKYRV